MKINSKTKKEVLVSEVVARGLFESVSVAETKTAIELYRIIKEDDAKKEQPTAEVEPTTEQKTSEPKKEVVIKLPKKRNKKDANKCVTTLGDKLRDLGFKTGMSQEEISQAIGITEPELKELENTTVESVIDETQVKEIIEGKTIVEKAPKTKEPVTPCEHIKTDDDLKDEIITEICKMAEQVKGLECKIKKAEKEIRDLKDENTNSYLSMVRCANAIAETRTPELRVFYDILKDGLNKVKHINEAFKTEVWDMSSLILEELEKKREAERIIQEKQEAEERKLKELVTYDTGVHVNYIDGEFIKVKGLRTSKYENYLLWFDYAVEKMEKLQKALIPTDEIKILKQRKEAIANVMKKNVVKFVKEWRDDSDDESAELLEGIVSEFISDRNFEKAMANIVSLIDELEF